MVLEPKLRWLGTGLACPLNPEHKTMYWIPQKYGDRLGGYYFCAHADHDPLYGVRSYTKNLWTDKEIEQMRLEEDRAKEPLQELS